MREQDDGFAALREALDAYGIERAPEVVAEARIEAEARVRRMLAEAMADSLLERASADLPTPEPKRAPAPRPARRAPEPRPAPTQPQREPAKPGAEAVYVYGIVRAGAELPLGIAGVDPAHGTEELAEGELAALVSRVPLAEFGEAALHENLNDVAWLEEKARAHEHVLDAALASTTVVPLRLCTIYAGEAQVRAMLAEERARLLDGLDRLGGHAEWGVKLIASKRALAEAALAEAPLEEPAAADSPGFAYLADKRREAHVRDRTDEIATDWAELVHGRLLEIASEGLVNRPQNPELSGHEGQMLLNGAYLVSEQATRPFREAVDALRGEFGGLGVTIDLTGPWPAYNFVVPPESVAR